jgi:O-antigen/teichoic acid export membrane protein
MIALAWMYQSIWSLVLGAIVGGLTKTYFTHTFVPGERHRFVWDNEKLSKIYSFSRWIFISSIFGFLVTHSDRIWLAGFVSAERLGVYSIAVNLALILNTLMGKLSMSAVLPALSKVSRNRPWEIVDYYYKVRLFIDPIIMLTAGFIFVLGPNIIDILYDDRYIDAGWMLSVLSLSVISGCFLLGQRYLVSVGLVKERAMSTMLHAISLNLMIPILYYFYGFSGALYAIVLSSIIPVAFLFVIMSKYGMLNLVREFRFLPFVFLGMGVGLIFKRLIEG